MNRTTHKQDPPKVSSHPIFLDLTKLCCSYRGIRNIPHSELAALGAKHQFRLYHISSDRIFVLPASMEAFYINNGFHIKMVGGKRVYVPPNETWSDELKRKAIRFCVAVVLKKGDNPSSCTAAEFRKHISGIFADFGQNKKKMLEFAGYKV